MKKLSGHERMRTKMTEKQIRQEIKDSLINWLEAGLPDNFDNKIIEYVGWCPGFYKGNGELHYFNYTRKGYEQPFMLYDNAFGDFDLFIGKTLKLSKEVLDKLNN